MGGFSRVSGAGEPTPTPSRCAGEWRGFSIAMSRTAACTRYKSGREHSGSACGWISGASDPPLRREKPTPRAV